MTDTLTSPEDDPIEIILAFARQIEGARLQRDPMQIHDRDRWFVTLILEKIVLIALIQWNLKLTSVVVLRCAARLKTKLLRSGIDAMLDDLLLVCAGFYIGAVWTMIILRLLNE